MSDLRPLTGDSPSRSGRLDRVLSDLLAQAPEIEAAAVVSFDGLPMVSALPPSMDEDRVAAMSAALLSLGERAAEGLGRGQLSQVYIEGETGTVFLVSCDDEAVLVAVAAAGAKAGLMLYEVRRSAQSIAAVLQEDDAAQAPAPSPVAQYTAQHPQHPAPAQPQLQPQTQPGGYQDAPQAQPAAVPAMPGYLPMTSAPTDAPSQNGYHGPAGSNGWSSYAPGGVPGEPTPWS